VYASNTYLATTCSCGISAVHIIRITSSSITEGDYTWNKSQIISTVRLSFISGDIQASMNQILEDDLHNDIGGILHDYIKLSNSKEYILPRT